MLCPPDAPIAKHVRGALFVQRMELDGTPSRLDRRLMPTGEYAVQREIIAPSTGGALTGALPDIFVSFPIRKGKAGGVGFSPELRRLPVPDDELHWRIQKHRSDVARFYWAVFDSTGGRSDVYRRLKFYGFPGGDD